MNLKSFSAALGLVVAVLGSTFAPAASAADGCKVLLCMAGNWRNIAECRPEVEAAMRDVARGRHWPRCDQAGASNTNGGYLDPNQCPEQYRTREFDWNDRVRYSCPFNGMTEVVVEGQVWSRVYWSTGGDSVTQWMPPARASAASTGTPLDERFTTDYAVWRAAEDARIERERLAALNSN